MNRPQVRLLVALIVLGFAAPALAGEGRTPIWQTTPITASGKYIVTRDITGNPGIPVIDIQVTGVDIDFNGFTLTGNGAETIRSVGQSNIVIRNGSIVGSTAGIDIRLGSGVVIEDVIITITSVTGRGIYLEEICNFALRRNSVAAREGDAILVDNRPFGCNGTIENNLIVNGGRGIAVLRGKPVPILNNRIHDTSATAIYVDVSESGLIQGNAISHAGLDTGPHHGIHLSDSNGFEIRENTVMIAQEHGILIGGHNNLVLDNVVNAASQDGIRIEGSRNQVERNTLNENNRLGGAWGLHFVGGGGDNTYGRNMARGNGGSAAMCPSAPPPAKPATTDFCDEQIGNSSFNDNFLPSLF
jgi:parallel beta-helix repeat protein